ncbi:CinA family nicotinamide mononucleotide deamidase-related protein [Chloroflexus sp. MS-CIW-1]|uniref:competence/damage-inducible protein A n=1 Tax=Chloroflexus sp. MS-CIW-1 TaxID=3055768 RepID=UPI002647AFBA|nr:CinA family nicotinamide mononucleotide deamidase-related protein [Chloroflexus sp. MS-CIW-1]MDN5273630.1 CinA family nicotinamide mononucleotide deamidase-related protein [Chloroflexus sp. MS-CIW-1]
MDAEIIAIGSELLLGVTVDTNSAYLARQLAAAGVNVYRKMVVGDNVDRITTAVREALSRADLVICTGGLGPTLDDVTREAVAAALDRPLEFHPELLDQIAARFAAMNRPMSESNRRQAYVPAGARIIPNPRGTAPAFLIEDERGTVVVLPGVPGEMRYLFETAVLPYLREERGITTVILVRTLHAVGLGESVIGERIADLMQQTNPTVGISAKRARYELRIGARAESQAEAEAMIARTEAIIRERLGQYLLGEEELPTVVARLLRERHQTLALYEGILRAPVLQALLSLPDSDQVLRGVEIHPLDSPADTQAASDLAAAGAANVAERWQSSIGLGVQPASWPDTNGFTSVSFALITPTGERRLNRPFDLRSSDGFEFIGTAALDLLRRYLAGEPE